MRQQAPTLTESLFLLSLSEDSGRPKTSYMSYGLAGAALADLYLSGRAKLSEDRVPRLELARTHYPSSSALMEACRARISRADRPLKLRHWVTKLACLRGMRQLAGGDLAARGWVEVEATRLLGLFPRTRWHLTSTGHAARATLRAEIEALLFNESARVDEPTATLIALASGIHLLKHNFDRDRLRMHKRHIRTLIRGDWPAARATRKTIEAVNAAGAAVVVA